VVGGVDGVLGEGVRSGGGGGSSQRGEWWSGVLRRGGGLVLGRGDSGSRHGGDRRGGGGRLAFAEMHWIVRGRLGLVVCDIQWCLFK
jgi:hypothetical protein